MSPCVLGKCQMTTCAPRVCGAAKDLPATKIHHATPHAHTPTQARFNGPLSVLYFTDSKGNTEYLLVSDGGNNRIRRVVPTSGVREAPRCRV